MIRSVIKYSRCVTNTLRNFSTSVDKDEIARFSAIAKNWWDINGDFELLHTMNKLRVPLIRDGLQKLPHAPINQPLKDLKLLDVGCGGGILSEPLVRLGAEVIGLDATYENIETAKYHASISYSLPKNRLTYVYNTIEDFYAVDDHKNACQFDGVILSEIIEHVLDVENFLKVACSLVKPGGSIFVTTINKTMLSYYMAIVAAEKIFKLVPDGIHDWNKFISPEDVKAILEKNNFEVRLVHGMSLNPVNNEWSWSGNNKINYALHAVNYSNEDKI